MGDKTNIAWSDATFNPWRGCQRVSEGCRYCYAETLSKRNPQVLGEWGPNGVRAIAAESYWQKPAIWNRQAEREGKRRRVFCASLADVFEDREELHAPRLRLLDIIRTTPWLDWQLLTKRPENVLPSLEHAAYFTDNRTSVELFCWLTDWLKGYPPANVWLGTSIENQEVVSRLDALRQTPAVVYFVSAEPLLGPLNLHFSIRFTGARFGGSAEICDRAKNLWVITGCESGLHRREFSAEWVREIYSQCRFANVPFFNKQMIVNNLVSHDLAEWPEDLRVQEFPQVGVAK